MIDKKIIREEMLLRRGKLTDEDVRRYSETIMQRLVESSFYRECHNLCIYQAFRNEVSCDTIMPLSLSDGKRVYTSVTDKTGKSIEFYQITEYTKWQQGAYGIMEPVITPDDQPLQEPALVLMPGLAFDRNKHRLGYGGGYYDRYLAGHQGNITAALCYSFQITEHELPYEEHDILPDYIVTEQEII